MSDVEKNNAGISEDAAKYVRQSRFQMIWHQFKKNKGGVIGLIILCLIIVITIVGGILLRYEEDVVSIHATEAFITPCKDHLFGTDHLGRDVFSRVIYGARYSFLIGILSVAISVVFGTFMGAVAGYFGGIVETIIMRVVELLLMVPGMLLTIVLVSAFGIGLRNLIIAFGISTIPHFARNARAAVITVAGNEYVEAAKAVGAKDLRIIFTHVLPNSLSPIFVQATTRIAGCITSAATFSFLGLGVEPPTPEWGAMLSDARPYMRSAGYLIIFPGIAILILCLSINLIGDGLRDALDPKLKR